MKCFLINFALCARSGAAQKQNQEDKERRTQDEG